MSYTFIPPGDGGIQDPTTTYRNSNWLDLSIGKNGLISSVSSSSIILPSAIPGLQAWWRSDLGVSSTSGGSVTSWVDQSSNAYSLAPVVNAISYVSSGGVNNLPYLSWPGGALQGGSDLTCSTFPVVNQPLDCFLVLRPTQGVSTFGTNYYAMDFGSGNNNATQISQSTYPPLVVGMYNGSATNLGSLTVGTDYVVETLFNADGSSQVYLNGVSQGTGTVGTGNTTGGISIGCYYANSSGHYCYVGYIYEAIVYTTTLSSANRTAINAYFQSRYGL